MAVNEEALNVEKNMNYELWIMNYELHHIDLNKWLSSIHSVYIMHPHSSTMTEDWMGIIDKQQERKNPHRTILWGSVFLTYKVATLKGIRFTFKSKVEL